jgi:hypothetical protein
MLHRGACVVLGLFLYRGPVMVAQVKALAAGGAAPYLPNTAMKANLTYWHSILRDHAAQR